MLPNSYNTTPLKRSLSLSTEEVNPPKQQKVNDDPAEPAGQTGTPQEVPSMGARLAALREHVAHAPDQFDVPAQLLFLLQGAEKAQDIQDWVGALTRDLCKARPDLMQCLFEQLWRLLPSFTPEQIEQSLDCCLDLASSVDMSEAMWMRLCVSLSGLKLPAMKALLTALRRQEDLGQSPAGGTSLIEHVQNVVEGMEQLDGKGFSANDSRNERREIQAPGVTTNNAPILNRDVLELVAAHVLNLESHTERHNGFYRQLKARTRAVQNLALVTKEFFPRSASMLAHNQWLNEMLLRKAGRANGYKLNEWINKLVNLDAQAITSLLSFPERRLGMLLRDLLLCATVEWCFRGNPTVADVYSSLHDRAVLQLATQGWMPACFAEHLGLWALPLHALAMAYRMLPDSTPDIGRLFELAAGDYLSAYPEDVQAQTLMSLLLSVNVLTADNPSGKLEIMARLKELMGKANWRPGSSSTWLFYQWNHLSDILALIEVPDRVFIGDAANLPNELLAGLQQHHGVGQDSGLLIEDPFGERYVLWTPGDISLLAALCKRAEKSVVWKPLALVDCLVDLLRQLCSVSHRGDGFVKPGFMAAFPVDMLDSAFRQLTDRQQGLVLIRDYSKETPDSRMIVVFATNEEIDPQERLDCLREITRFAKDETYVLFAKMAMARVPSIIPAQRPT